MKEPKINIEELKAEMDRLRVPVVPEFTESQLQIIDYGRSRTPRVQWKHILVLFKEKYGITIKESTLRTRYETWKNK